MKLWRMSNNIPQTSMESDYLSMPQTEINHVCHRGIIQHIIHKCKYHEERFRFNIPTRSHVFVNKRVNASIQFPR